MASTTGPTLSGLPTWAHSLGSPGRARTLFTLAVGCVTEHHRDRSVAAHWNRGEITVRLNGPTVFLSPVADELSNVPETDWPTAIQRLVQTAYWGASNHAKPDPQTPPALSVLLTVRPDQTVPNWTLNVTVRPSGNLIGNPSEELTGKTTGKQPKSD